MLAGAAGKPWSPVERVGTLAGFHLGKLGEQSDALGLCKAYNRRSLRLQPES